MTFQIFCLFVLESEFIKYYSYTNTPYIFYYVSTVKIGGQNLYNVVSNVTMEHAGIMVNIIVDVVNST